jgi:hypothetical protein
MYRTTGYPIDIAVQREQRASRQARRTDRLRALRAFLSGSAE